MANVLLHAHNTCVCRRQTSRPAPPAKPDYDYGSPEYDLQTMGECDRGSYIEIYSPQTPQPGPSKAVVYLHGFDLGASQIYGTHLEHLVKQGYYVFYPNFQTGFCSFPDNKLETIGELAEEIVGDVPLAILDHLEGDKDAGLQDVWMESALDSVHKAYAQIGWTDETPVETYLFGHSLGGLLALSWAYYVKSKGLPSNLLPQQVVVADPVPKAGPVDLKQTGSRLTMPVGILHGNDDTIARPSSWDTPFQSIKTPHKKMYLSFTDHWGCPVMYANHEQAAVDTSFVSDVTALKVLDGIGTENNLNWRYIWYGLDQVLSGATTADQIQFDMGQWSDGTAVRKIEVLYS